MKILIVALVLTFAAYMFFSSKRTEDPRHLVNQASVREIANRPFLPTKRSLPAQPSQSEGTTECVKAREELVQLSNDQISSLLKQRRFPLTLKCSDFEAKQSRGRADEVYKDCQAYLESTGDHLMGMCLTRLLFYKSVLIAQITKDETDYEYGSIDILFHHLMAEFPHNVESDRFRKLAKIFASRLPYSVSAQKMALTGELMKVSKSTPPFSDPEFWGEVEYLARRFPEDTDLKELSFFRLTQDKERINDHLSELQRFTNEQPDSALGHYYLGNLYFQAGDRVAALTHAQEAVRLDPANPVYKKTISKLTKGANSPFELQIGFPLDEFY